MNDDIQTMTPEVAGRVAVYAMMSANAYKKKKGRYRFDLERLGWEHVDLDGESTNVPTKEEASGLAYNIYEKVGTNKTVIAFRGTDSKKDYLLANLAVWPFNKQYRQARKAVKKYLNENSERSILATGHSLGGGLALCVSVRQGIEAITFDPSPRIFGGIFSLPEPAERMIVFQKGEILEIVRKLWKKDDEAVGKEDTYQCDYDFKEKHRGDLLAKALLEDGASANLELDPSLAAVVE
jgi:putative lipase involved disintegration of autophagic bodies